MTGGRGSLCFILAIKCLALLIFCSTISTRGLTNPIIDSVDSSYVASGVRAATDTLPNRFLEIDKIFILGNKITKDQIVLREIHAKIGETYYEDDLKRILEEDKKKILNTRLFLTVEIELMKLSDTKVDILIKVSERWYIFPIPIFKIATGNINDWWTNQGASFKQVNYGLKFVKYNFRGRNEKLKLTGQLDIQSYLSWTIGFRISTKVKKVV